MDNGPAIYANGGNDSPHDSQTHDVVFPATSGNRRQRSLSGGSILSRLSWLRSSFEEVRPSPQQLADQAGDIDNPIHRAAESAVAQSQKISKSRKRKGSLRKTALLGTGKLKAEGRERRNSLLQRRPSTKLAGTSQDSPDDEATRVISPIDTLQRSFSYELPVAASSSENSWSDPTQNLSLLETLGQPEQDTGAPSLQSPIKSPTSQSYASTTTDEDEALSFSRPSNGHLHQQTLKSAASSNAPSYFPSLSNKPRHRVSNPKLSPLSAMPMDAYGTEEEWDYSETEWWGWAVLIVTWIVFVVGMGSCFEVWSWAWDVGQTPYAPPELEDDPTLPIVGYYPALIILTAVMAWVWVVVAWVGMKYFKHAKIQGDDT